MNTITVAQLLNTSGQILDDLRSVIVRSRPPRGGPDRLRVSLVLTIAEQFEATLQLANAHMSTHSATHVRSMIEALVAMKMLESDVGYADQMKYEKLRGERRVYEGILADPNIPDHLKDPIKKSYEICDSECEKLRATGRKPKKISDDLGTAGLWHLIGPYSMLCAFSHNDLAVLALRHQGEKSMVYKQDDLPEFVQSVVSTALLVLMDATHQFGEIAKFPDNHFELVFAAMNQKWGNVVDKSVTR
ncbi:MULTISPECIES: DUF5677 domain-containing protein [unclassified Burkholderia]|uniref:DUF5677 domain-containing protein n=1 Tax=unclassified Burkholderia TaxID=2613784 RepID=UPI00141EC5BB|nr:MULTISPECIES: DUF5677 domain-containing protein [unclassified Burkholderia]NIE82974.1 hypothetical protein [Burkholderia sp. Tr-860]NIF61601.1 hypothetical protein [Burkholderia sp. Cy-647]NIF95012.1 hypothetical protein [Burkholderia sp. Ax-1720]